MKFHPRTDWSYSAGVAFITTDPEPLILLVLENREETPGKESVGIQRWRRYWELPLGRYDPHSDRDLMDTAIRELREETALRLNRSQFSNRMSKVFQMPSKRAEYRIHQDVFFLVTGRRPPLSELKANSGGMAPEIESAALFSLSRLSVQAPLSNGAFLARGHRMRLMQLLKRCQRMAPTQSESEYYLFLIQKLKRENRN